MSNPTITDNGVTFTFDDGECVSVDIRKAGQLDETTLPASDSDGTFVVDFNGVLKTITLSGDIFDSDTTRTSTGTTTTVEQQIAWLQNLVDGAQTGYTLNTTYQSNKTVYCRSVKFEEKAGQLKVPFTIEFVEGL